ncbi:MAG: FHA domain-containing protein [Planctomycetes bacterium]|nr:FHA domain-containing protein [Planctomycetota bacterium]
MMASIIVMSGNHKGNYYPLGRRTTVIGRDEALLIQILDDGVSRKHVQIYFDKDTGKYFALDMKSKNGVFVNNNKINDETSLMDGDHIRLGETVLFFTQKDFPNSEDAMSHFKKVGQRANMTKPIEGQ